MNAPAVYLIFGLSGASALVYQVIWARWLGLILGNTTLSISIVLGTFMAGLALGSWAAGRLISHIENPLRYYAYMELGIGLFAFCSPLMTRLVDLAFVAVVSPESPTAFSILVRIMLSGAMLLVPTTFMGATLPLLTDFFHRSAEHTRNWRVGILYGANTLGAAVGIAATSFFLIEVIGILATTFVAAVLNLLVAALAYRFSRPVEIRRAQGAIHGPGTLDGPGRLAVAVVTSSGALALASEILWTRTLETLIGNSTYAFASIVLLYLIGIAVGSWAMSLMVTRLRALPLWLAGMLLGMGLWTIVAVELFERIINSMIPYSGVMVPLSIILFHYLKAVSVLLPLSLFSGACFPLVTRIIDVRDQEDAQGALVAKAYAWNTVGALIGSLAAGLVIAPLWDYINSLYIVAAAYCLTALVASVFIGVSKWEVAGKVRVSGLIGLLSLAFAFLSITRGGDSDSYTRRIESVRPQAKVVFHKAGLQGVTTAIKHRFVSNQDMLLVNGMGMTVKTTDTKMMAHIPLLLHPDPANSLVICLGMGTTYRSALSYGKKVTVVELVKEVTDAFDYFYEDATALRAAPGGRIIVNDGRSFLKLTREKFDVITIDPPPPIDAAGVNNLYSREFIELARDHLNEGGIMAHWMPSPGTMSGVDDLDTYNMLIRTFAQVFPYTYVHKSFAGIGLHVIGSMEPVTISKDAIEKKLDGKRVNGDLNEWDRVPSDFFSKEWTVLPPGFLAGPVITDNNPNLEFYLVRTILRGEQKMHPTNFW